MQGAVNGQAERDIWPELFTFCLYSIRSYFRADPEVVELLANRARILSPELIKVTARMKKQARRNIMLSEAASVKDASSTSFRLVADTGREVRYVCGRGRR